MPLLLLLPPWLPWLPRLPRLPRLPWLPRLSLRSTLLPLLMVVGGGIVLLGPRSRLLLSMHTCGGAGGVC